jgi:uncharacterized membrane protein (UPF0136 family)
MSEDGATTPTTPPTAPTQPVRPRMAKAHALYAALSAMAIAFALAFAFPAYRPTAVFWYYPLERRWAYETRASGLAMDWYGRCALATLIAALAFALVYAIARRLPALSRRAFGLWAAWVATIMLLAMSLYAYQLAVRVPVPEPLPSWYEPR